MQVGDIMHADVKTAAPTTRSHDVATVLHENGISSVVVLEGRSSPAS